jgi:hypothetical protein
MRKKQDGKRKKILRKKKRNGRYYISIKGKKINIDNDNRLYYEKKKRISKKYKK